MGASWADWVKSGDVTVSCESSWLPGETPMAAIPCLRRVSLCIRGVAHVGAHLKSDSVALQQQCPISRKHFTAIFPEPILLLHLGFNRRPNVLGNHSRYPVWARGPRRALEVKKIFRAEGQVSLSAGT